MEPESVVGSWSHAHEEDHDGLQVFRPADFPFPPSRGRTSFTLNPDLTAQCGSPGPTDRGITDDGTWALAGDVLTVDCPGWQAVYHVMTAAPDRLELQPAPFDGGGHEDATQEP